MVLYVLIIVLCIILRVYVYKVGNLLQVLYTIHYGVTINKYIYIHIYIYLQFDDSSMSFVLFPPLCIPVCCYSILLILKYILFY